MAAAYITVLLALLFVQGMRMIIQDGVDHRKAIVVGLAFWLGVGFQGGVIFSDMLQGFWAVLLGNGMTAGAIVAIIMMLFMDFTSPRRRRLAAELSPDSLPEIDAFLREFASLPASGTPLPRDRLSAVLWRVKRPLPSVLQNAVDSDTSNGVRRLAVSAPRRRHCNQGRT